MNFRREKPDLEMERLNLVPIMDAVFIFIFFLLFSAQFIKIYEIETSAPVVSEVPQDIKLDKDPLNLKVKVNNKIVSIHTGIDEKIVLKVEYTFKNLDKIRGKIWNLKLKNPKEDHAIIVPSPGVDYEKIINVIEAVQVLPNKMKTYNLNDKEISKIFSQIVLEPLSEN